MTQARLPKDTLAGKWAQKIARALYLDNKECEYICRILEEFAVEFLCVVNKNKTR